MIELIAAGYKFLINLLSAIFSVTILFAIGYIANNFDDFSNLEVGTSAIAIFTSILALFALLGLSATIISIRDCLKRTEKILENSVGISGHPFFSSRDDS